MKQNIQINLEILLDYGSKSNKSAASPAEWTHLMVELPQTSLVTNLLWVEL